MRNPYRRLLLAFSAVLLIAGTTRAQRADNASLDTLLNRVTRANKLMGYLQLSKNGEVIYGRGFGEARPGVPNTSRTAFRVGSISKVFTAALVMQQIDAGKLSLDDKLSKWFPQVKNAERITIDQLLSHYSGIRNLTDDTDFISWQDTVSVPAGIIRRIAGSEPDFQPGARYEYSNSNYMLLGYILQNVSGTTYASLLQERISKPLKLKQTAIGPDVVPAKSRDADSWIVLNGKWMVDSLSRASVAGAAGGIVSTVPELAIFIDALMRGRLTSAASLKKMMEIRGGYGRGLMRIPFYEHTAYGHNGHIDNFSSSLGYFPKDSLVVALVCNGVNYNTNNLLIGVLSLYYGKAFKMPDFSNGLQLTKAQLERFTGVYTNSDLKLDITITASDRGLSAQATDQERFELEAVSPTLFGNDGVGVQLDFAKTEGRPDTMLLMQGGARIPFARK